MSASEGALKGIFERNGTRATWAGIAVVTGVAFEIFLAFAANEPVGLKVGAALANAVVAIGVALELGFGHRAAAAQSELSRRSELALAAANDRLSQVEFENGFTQATTAQALERAAKAERETAELMAQAAPRNLTESQFEGLKEALKGRVTAVVITTPTDFEATRFARQIALALKEADIEVLIGDQRIGMVWENVYLVFPSGSAAHPSYLLTHPLFVAFKRAGFSVGAGDRTQVPMADLPADIPVIMIGEKGIRRSPEPPFMARFPIPKAAQGCDETKPAANPSPSAQVRQV